MTTHKGFSIWAIIALLFFSILSPFQVNASGLFLEGLIDQPDLALVDYPVINEFLLNHTGLDTEEFVEVLGNPNTDYSQLSLLQVEGDAGGTLGKVLSIHAVGTTDAYGVWSTKVTGSQLNDGTTTILLVSNYTGTDITDLDSNNDGLLNDPPPWDSLVDSVGVHDGEAGDYVYSSTSLTSAYDQFSGLPGGASRIPNGADTDTTNDWMRNDFDMAGILGNMGTALFGEALNTPGKINLAIPLINEFVYNHTGQDTKEFVEIYGYPNSNYLSTVLLAIESDSGGKLGFIEAVIGIGFSDPLGYYFYMLPENTLGDNSISFLLVYEFSGSPGQDLDTNDDGVLDITPWTAILDGVGVHDGGVDDYGYADVSLTSGYDGLSGIPGGASRIPNAVETNTAADWMRNDFDGAGLPGLSGALSIGEAYNTPGSENWGALASNDLALTKTGPEIAHPGENVTYSIKIENTSIVKAVNVKFTDTLPPDTVFVSQTSSVTPTNPQPGVYEWAFGDIPAAGSVSFDLTIQISALTELGWIINQAKIESLLTPDDPANNIRTWKTKIPQPLMIHEIQGASHYSPKYDYIATEIPGIVTWVTSRSFYLQTPDDLVDGDDATSEGILVYVGTTPTVSAGDFISVTASVDEYYPGGFGAGGLSTTELVDPVIQTISTGNPLPTASVIGANGRMPPTEVISNDSIGDVEDSLFDPNEDGIDFYESLEGMLVTIEDAVAVGPTNRYGEIPVVPDLGVWVSGLNARGGVVIQESDYNPERIILDDTLYSSEPLVDTGAAFVAPITGLLDYSFGNFKLQNTGALPATTGSLEIETTNLSRSEDQITVATFNVENLDPNPLDGDDDTARFATLATQIVSHLDTPDIIVLEEIQDNSGATDDGVTAADQTYQALIDAIDTAGGPLYTYADIDPVNNMDGGAPGANIRVGFLYRTDRGLSFVSRAGGDAITPTSVILGVSGVELSYSPGRIDPANSAWLESRKPLVGEFLFNNRKLFVIGNHFNSKSGDSYLFGRVQPPVMVSEAQRIQQAQVVNAFVDSILALDPTALVIAAGDLNDFQFSNPLLALEGGVLTNLHSLNAVEERYTYIYDGNSQALDHILVSTQLMDASPMLDVVHVNAEYDHLENVSDHDPVLARFSLPLVEVNFQSDKFYVSEGDEFGSLTVVLEATSAVTVTVQYTTTAQTAIPGDDYVTSQGEIKFAPGETSATINIPLIDNDQIQVLERTFLVTLADPIEGILGSIYETIVYIMDDEIPFLIYLPVIIVE